MSNEDDIDKDFEDAEELLHAANFKTNINTIIEAGQFKTRMLRLVSAVDSETDVDVLRELVKILATHILNDVGKL